MMYEELIDVGQGGLQVSEGLDGCMVDISITFYHWMGLQTRLEVGGTILKTWEQMTAQQRPHRECA